MDAQPKHSNVSGLVKIGLILIVLYGVVCMMRGKTRTANLATPQSPCPVIVGFPGVTVDQFGIPVLSAVLSTDSPTPVVAVEVEVRLADAFGRPVGSRAFRGTWDQMSEANFLTPGNRWSPSWRLYGYSGTRWAARHGRLPNGTWVWWFLVGYGT